jgi:hypothetical protein
MKGLHDVGGIDEFSPWLLRTVLSGSKGIRQSRLKS